MIYFDYTAHVPVSARCIEAFAKTETACIGNANSLHCAGKASMALMQEAQRRIAGILSVAEEEIIFTSGASESNNTAIKGIAYANRNFGRHIITSPLEHLSVGGCLTSLQERGYEIEVLPLERDGSISLSALRDSIRQDTVLVTLCAVDSELGSIQPVAEASEIIRKFPHCRLHVDMTQAIGKMPVDLSAADTVSFSGHKFGGIVGSGALIRKKTVDMEPLIHGGVSTTLYRSGTPAVGLAVSLAEALAEASESWEERWDRVSEQNRYLRTELKKRSVRIHSPEQSIPHILNVGIDGIKGYEMRDLLADRGVCVSVKSACSVDATPSRSVYAVTGNRRQALESFRISLSHMTTMDELDVFLTVLDEIRKEKKI